VSKEPRLHTIDSLVAGVREATRGDLSALRALGPGVAGDVGRLRIRHHRVAQLAAAGMPPEEISEYIGVSGKAISTLLGSPAMQALVSQYLAQAWHESSEVMRRARLAGAAGVAEMHKRLEAAAEELSNKDLALLTFGLLDRGGVGVVSKSEHTFNGLTADEIKSIVENRGTVLDIEVIARPEDREPPLGDVGGDGSVPPAERGDESSEGGAPVREITRAASSG